MEESAEIIHEFLVESNENLAQLDQDLVALEQRPGDGELLARIFRTIHTIKGTCGFLGFSTLESITHWGENILSQLRDGGRRLDPSLTTLLLEAVDAVKSILAQIESSGTEGEEQHLDLRNRLETASKGREMDWAALFTGRDTGERGDPDGTSEEDAAEAPGLSRLAAYDLGAPSAPEETNRPAARLNPAAPPKEVLAANPPERTVPGKRPPARTSVAESTIRVDVGLLDSLMNLAGELVLSRNQILQYASDLDDPGLNATSQRLNLVTTEVQAAVMKTRMQPIGVVWNKLPRVVRDLANSVSKQIRLEMEGAETELDKTIIEAIKDPLTHIIRNSCDHGIETPESRSKAGKAQVGTLSLRAFHEGGQVNIEIRDDGIGIDPGRIRRKAIEKGIVSPEQADRLTPKELQALIFAPGFSTAAEVTKVSGRGVGMDVVKTNIEKIGGTLDLQSRPGSGTAIRIKIPLTLAIIPALIVSCEGERYAIPQVNLLELVRLDAGASANGVEWLHGTPVYRLRGKLLPLVYLRKVLGLAERGDAAWAGGSVNIVVLQADERSFGLVVDQVRDTQEIVVKPLNHLLNALACYAGATVMGDGAVALILDVLGVAHSAAILDGAHQESRSAQAGIRRPAAERQSILVFSAGTARRLAVPLSLVARLEEFSRSDLERAHENPVIQYRGEILPLLPLAEVMGFGTGRASGREETLPVIVFNSGDRRFGLIVDDITDIVEDTLEPSSRSRRDGIAGSAVIGEKVTDFLDLPFLLHQLNRIWPGRQRERDANRPRVMVTDSEPFSRGSVSNYLELHGCAVVQARDGRETIEKLAADEVDVLLASVDLPDLPLPDMIRRIRQNPSLGNLPILGLYKGEAGPMPRDGDECAELVSMHDRERLLQSIVQLAAALERKRTQAELAVA